MNDNVYVIFGAGKAGRDLARVFPAKVSYFVDNDSHKWGTYADGILINSPEQLLQESEDNLRIFIASMYFNQIKEQLAAMGFEDQKHYFYIVPYYSLLRTTAFLDVINMQVGQMPADQGKSSSLFDRLRLSFDIQEELVSKQEDKRVLLVIDDKGAYTDWAARIQCGLKELFKLQVLLLSDNIAIENDLGDIACRYRKLGYSKLIYLGHYGAKVEQFGTYFADCCFLDAVPDIPEKKDWIDYLYQITDKLGVGFKKVSAVVPNYNYEQYLCRRLRTIINQHYPIYEIIFLDDASSDDSVMLAECLLDEQYGLKQIIVNDQNSSSAFKQWKKGIEAAQGDYIWIAEADDYASPIMLHKLMAAFGVDKNVVLSFCDSMFVGNTGEWEGFGSDAHAACVQTGPQGAMTGGIYDGQEFIKQYLESYNSIPNVSAAVIKKASVRQSYLEKITMFKQFGDWYLYVLLLEEGKLAYDITPMNFFRRQSRSVTVTMNNKEQQDELNVVARAAAKAGRSESMKG